MNESVIFALSTFKVVNKVKRLILFIFSSTINHLMSSEYGIGDILRDNSNGLKLTVAIKFTYEF